MWICFNDGFVSAVASDVPGTLMVRGRAYDHLRNVFAGMNDPNTNRPYEIHITPHHDYRYRVFVNQAVWADLVRKRTLEIDYTNFKDSVKDDKLHTLYNEFWYLHMIYQNGKKWWKREKKRWASYYAEKDHRQAEQAIETDLELRGSER